MAKRECPHCFEEIDTRAKVCPHCQKKPHQALIDKAVEKVQGGWTDIDVVLVIMIVVALIIIIIALLI